MTKSPGPGPRLAEMVRRLRARPVSSWRHGSRERDVRAALQRFADLAAEASAEPLRAVPDVGVSALPDQLAVLVGDARAAGVPDTALESLLDDLAGSLGLRDVRGSAAHPARGEEKAWWRSGGR